MCPSRNIPAHAGKTLPCSPSPDILSEHPRARGENQVRVDGHAVGHGTSPRTRGKRPIWCRPTEAGRNIPAHAGKTSGWCMGRGPRWGTSPRTRGKHLLTCGSSFLRVILHSVLFFCTVGIPWNPPAAPSFLSVLVPESSFTASSGPACFRLTAALFGGTVDDF